MKFIVGYLHEKLSGECTFRPYQFTVPWILHKAEIITVMPNGKVLLKQAFSGSHQDT